MCVCVLQERYNQLNTQEVNEKEIKNNPKLLVHRECDSVKIPALQNDLIFNVKGKKMKKKYTISKLNCQRAFLSS